MTDSFGQWAEAYVATGDSLRLPWADAWACYKLFSADHLPALSQKEFVRAMEEKFGVPDQVQWNKRWTPKFGLQFPRRSSTNQIYVLTAAARQLKDKLRRKWRIRTVASSEDVANKFQSDPHDLKTVVLSGGVERSNPAMKTLGYVLELIASQEDDREIKSGWDRSDALERFRVQKTNSDGTTSWQWGVRATEDIRPGEILAPFAMVIGLKKEQEWLLQPDERTAFAKYCVRVSTAHKLDGSSFAYRGQNYGNISAFINDYRNNPFTDNLTPDEKRAERVNQNAALEIVHYEGWPYPIIRAKTLIQVGEEVVLDYGNYYFNCGVSIGCQTQDEEEDVLATFKLNKAAKGNKESKKAQPTWSIATKGKSDKKLIEDAPPGRLPDEGGKDRKEEKAKVDEEEGEEKGEEEGEEEGKQEGEEEKESKEEKKERTVLQAKVKLNKEPEDDFVWPTTEEKERESKGGERPCAVTRLRRLREYYKTIRDSLSKMVAENDHKQLVHVVNRLVPVRDVVLATAFRLPYTQSEVERGRQLCTNKLFHWWKTYIRRSGSDPRELRLVQDPYTCSEKRIHFASAWVTLKIVVDLGISLRRAKGVDIREWLRQHLLAIPMPTAPLELMWTSSDLTPATSEPDTPLVTAKIARETKEEGPFSLIPTLDAKTSSLTSSTDLSHFVSPHEMQVAARASLWFDPADRRYLAWQHLNHTLKNPTSGTTLDALSREVDTISKQEALLRTQEYTARFQQQQIESLQRQLRIESLKRQLEEYKEKPDSDLQKSRRTTTTSSASDSMRDPSAKTVGSPCDEK